MITITLFDQRIIEQIELEMEEMDPFTRENYWDHKDMLERYRELQVELFDMEHENTPREFILNPQNEW